MKDTDLDEIIKSSKIIVQPGKYAYLKTKFKPEFNCFLIVQDDEEITVVVDEKNISQVSHEDEVKWFKLLKIKVSMPFVAKGFLAKVTKTIADKGLNVLIVSTFSNDYVLVKEETHKIAIEALKDIGFPIEDNQ